MGERTIAAHKYGLAKLGVKIKTKEDTYEISYAKIEASRICAL